MRKRHLLVMAPLAIALAALLVACGTSDGPDLQFDAVAYDAASEIQPSNGIPDPNPVRPDAVSQPEAVSGEAVAHMQAAAQEAVPNYMNGTAWDGYAPHATIVEFARSASLSTSRMAHPLEANSGVIAAATHRAESNAEIAASTGQVTESSVVSAVSIGVQPTPGTPKAALQDVSFTLVTVETDEGEQVIFVPSEGYEKVCPHRLRMASEFSDIDTADF